MDTNNNPILNQLLNNGNGNPDNKNNNTNPYYDPVDPQEGGTGLYEEYDSLWNKTYGGVFDTPSTSIGDVPTDLSEYTRLGVDYDPTDPVGSADKRARSQGTFEQLGNAGKRFAAGTFIETINTAGSMFDLEDYFNSDGEVGNAVTRWAERERRSMDSYAPIYIESDRDNMGNASWWIKNGADMGASVTAFAISGGMLGRGLSSLKWLSKLTKGYRGAKRTAKAADMALDAEIGLGSRALSGEAIEAMSNGQKIANTLVNSTMLNQAEALSSASSLFNEVYNDAISRGFSNEKAKELAASSASHVINTNRANILLNLTSASKFLKKADRLADARTIYSNRIKDIFRTRDKVSGDRIQSSWRDMLSEAGQESLEEVINVYAETRGKEYAENLFNNYRDTQIQHTKGLFDAFNVVGLGKQLATKEGIESAILGAIGGAGQTGLTNLTNEYVGGKLFGEQVYKLDEDGNRIRKKTEATYNKDTKYKPGQKATRDITDANGNILAKKGDEVTPQMILNNPSAFVHKAGDKVLDTQGNPIIVDSEEYEMAGDGSYMPVNKAAKLRREQAIKATERLQKLTDLTIKLRESGKKDERQYAAMDAISVLEDSRASASEKNESLDILARWKINGENPTVDFKSDEGKQTLEATKKELQSLGVDQLATMRNQAKGTLIKEQVWRSFETGSNNSLKAMYEDIRDLSPEEAERRGFGENYKTEAESVLGQIDKLSSYYKEYTAKYNPTRAKKLYDLAADSIHNNRLYDNLVAERERIIADINKQSGQEESIEETIAKIDEINKKQEEELDPLQKQLNKINDEISDLEAEVTVLEEADDTQISSFRTDREADYSVEMADRKTNKIKAITDLRRQKAALDAKMTEIRAKYNIDRLAVPSAFSQIDLTKISDIDKTIDDLKNTLDINNKLFAKIRDRKDSKYSGYNLNEAARERSLFTEMMNMLLEEQNRSTDPRVVTFNPYKRVSKHESRAVQIASIALREDVSIEEAFDMYVDMLIDSDQPSAKANKDEILEETAKKVRDHHVENIVKIIDGKDTEYKNNKKESDPDVPVGTYLDESIKEYKKSLSKKASARITANSTYENTNDIINTITGIIAEMDVDSIANMKNIQRYNSLGFTGKIVDNGDGSYDFIPDYSSFEGEFMLVSEQDVEYYENTKFPGTDDNMFDVSKMSEGMYKVVIKDPTRPMLITQDNMYQIASVTKGQARYKELLTSRINIIRNRRTRFEALREDKTTTRDKLSDSLEELLRMADTRSKWYSDWLNSDMFSDVEDIAEQYREKFGELDEELTPGQMEKILRIQAIIDGIESGAIDPSDLTDEIIEELGINKRIYTAKDSLIDILKELEQLEYDISYANSLASFYSTVDSLEDLDIPSVAKQLSQTKVHIQQLIASKKDLEVTADEIAGVIKALNEELAEAKVSGTNDDIERLTKNINEYNYTLSQIQNSLDTAKDSITKLTRIKKFYETFLTEDKRKEIAEADRKLRNEYAMISALFNGEAAITEDVARNVIDVYENIVLLMDELGDINGSITPDNDDVYEYMIDLLESLNNIVSISDDINISELRTELSQAEQRKVDLITRLGLATNSAEFDAIRKALDEVNEDIADIKSLEFEANLTDYVKPLIKSLSTSVRSLEKAREQGKTMNTSLAKGSSGFAKKLKNLTEVYNMLNSIVDDIPGYNNTLKAYDYNSLLLNADKVLEDYGNAVNDYSSLVDSLSDFSSTLLKSIEDNDKQLSGIINSRNLVKNKLSRRIKELRETSVITDDLNFVDEDGNPVFLSESELKNIKYNKITATLNDLSRTSDDIDRDIVKTKETLENLEKELSLIDKAKDRYDATDVAQFVQDPTEKNFFESDINLLRMSAVNEIQYYQKLVRILEFIKTNSDEMFIHDTELASVLDEDTLRLLYDDPNAYAKFLETKDINDLPTDPAILISNIVEELDDSMYNYLMSTVDEITDIDQEAAIAAEKIEKINQTNESLLEEAGGLVEEFNSQFNIESNQTAYEILGVDKNATQSQIKSAFRKKSLANHPDRGGDIKVMRSIIAVNELFKDPAKKSAYDFRLSTADARIKAIRAEVKTNEDKIADLNAISQNSQYFKEKSITEMFSEMQKRMEEIREELDATLGEIDDIATIIEEAYSNLNDIDEIERSLFESKNRELLEEMFEKQLEAQKGIDLTGEVNNFPVTTHDAESDPYRDEQEYEESQTILKKKDPITGSGAHIEYEAVIDKKGRPILRTKYDSDGNPIFVNNSNQIKWKTTLGRLERGELTDGKGNVITKNDLSIRMISADHPSIADTFAYSSGLFVESNINFASMGLEVNENGNIVIYDSKLFKQYIDNYNLEYTAIPDNIKKDIKDLKGKSETSPFTVRELDLLFRYQENPVGSESVSSTVRVRGKGVFMVLADSNGEIMSVSLNDNKIIPASNKQAGYEIVNTTSTSPVMAKRLQFKNNLAAIYSEQQDLGEELTFDELVEELREDNPDKTDSEIVIEIKKSKSNEIVSIRLDELISMEDSFTVNSDIPVKKAVRHIIQDQIQDYNTFRNTVLATEDAGGKIYDTNFTISNGHVLTGKNFRSMTEVFTRAEIADIKVNTTKKDESEKRRSMPGRPVDFTVNDREFTVNSRTGETIVATNSGNYFKAKPRRLNEDEAALALKIILTDFGEFVEDMEGRFKTSKDAVDTEGNKLDIESPLVRSEALKDAKLDQLPMISKLMFFSGKKFDAEDRMPWDISVERTSSGPFGKRNYLHYGANEVSIQSLKNNKAEQDKFIAWAMDNVNVSVNSKALAQAKDSVYYHPVEINYDNTTGKISTVYKKYDSYIDFLLEEDVLLTNALSADESRKLGGMGETIVSRYVSVSKNPTVVKPKPKTTPKKETKPKTETEGQTDTNKFDTEEVDVLNEKLEDVPANTRIKTTLSYTIKNTDDGKPLFNDSKQREIEVDLEATVVEDNDGNKFLSFDNVNAVVTVIKEDGSRNELAGDNAYGKQVINTLVDSMNVINSDGDLGIIPSPFSDILFSMAYTRGMTIKEILDHISTNNTYHSNVELSEDIQTIGEELSAKINNNEAPGFFVNMYGSKPVNKILGREIKSMTSIPNKKPKTEGEPTEDTEDTGDTEEGTLDAATVSERYKAIMNSLQKIFNDFDEDLASNISKYTESKGTRKDQVELYNFHERLKATTGSELTKELKEKIDSLISDINNSSDDYSNIVKSLNDNYDNLTKAIDGYIDQYTSAIKNDILGEAKFNEIKQSIENKPKSITELFDESTKLLQFTSDNKITMASSKSDVLSKVLPTWGNTPMAFNKSFNGVAYTYTFPSSDKKRAGKKVIIVGTKFNELGAAKKADAIVHELIHVASSSKINKYSKALLNGKSVPGNISQAFEDANSIRSIVINSLLDSGQKFRNIDGSVNRAWYNILGQNVSTKLASDVETTIDSLIAKRKKGDNVTIDMFITELNNNLSDSANKSITETMKYDIHEMVSSVFEDKDFANMLNNIEYKDDVSGQYSPLMDFFVTMLRNLLGLDIKSNSALKKAIDISLVYMNPNPSIYNTKTATEPTSTTTTEGTIDEITRDIERRKKLSMEGYTDVDGNFVGIRQMTDEFKERLEQTEGIESVGEITQEYIDKLAESGINIKWQGAYLKPDPSGKVGEGSNNDIEYVEGDTKQEVIDKINERYKDEIDSINKSKPKTTTTSAKAIDISASLPNTSIPLSSLIKYDNTSTGVTELNFNENQLTNIRNNITELANSGLYSVDQSVLDQLVSDPSLDISFSTGSVRPVGDNSIEIIEPITVTIDESEDGGLFFPDAGYPTEDDPKGRHTTFELLVNEVLSSDNSNASDLVRKLFENLSGSEDQLSSIHFELMMTRAEVDLDNLESAILSELRDITEEYNNGNTAYSTSTFDSSQTMTKFLSKYKKALNNIKSSQVKKVFNTSRLFKKDIYDRLPETASLRVSSTLTLDYLTKMDLYDGLSYYVLRSLISNKKSSLSTISRSDMYSVYMVALQDIKRSMITEGEDVSPVNQELYNFITEASNAYYRSKSSTEAASLKDDELIEGLDKIINSHFKEIMSSYGYDIYGSDEITDAPDNILDTIPDYVESYKINPVITTPSFARMLISSVSKKQSIVEQLGEDKEQVNTQIEKLNNILERLATIEDSMDPDLGKDDSTRKFLGAVATSVGINKGSIASKIRFKKPFTVNELERIKSIIRQAKPEIQNRINTAKKVSVTPSVNTLGLPSLENYGRVWNYIARRLSSNIPDYGKLKESLYDITSNEKYKESDKAINGLDDIANLLAGIEDMSDSVSVSKIASVLQSFAKYEMLHTIIISDSGGNLYETIANIDKKKSSILNKWISGITFKVTEVNKQKSSDKGSTITGSYHRKLTKIYGDENISPTERALKVLEEMGIVFNDPRSVVNMFEKQTGETIFQFVGAMITYSKKSINKEAKLLFSSREDAISGRIANLLELELLNDTDVITNQFLNENGDLVYGLQLNHTLSLMTSRINNSKISNVDGKRFVDGAPYLSDDYTTNSVLLKKVAQGQKLTTTVVSGTRFNQKGESGTDTSKLGKGDHLAVQITSALGSGTYMIPRAADRKVFNAFKFGNTKTLYTDYADALNNYTNYLLDELRVMKKYKDKGIPFNNIDPKKAISYRFFDVILNQSESDPDPLNLISTFVYGSDAVPSDYSGLSSFEYVDESGNRSNLLDAVKSRIDEFFNGVPESEKFNAVPGIVDKYVEVLKQEGVGDRTPKIEAQDGSYIEKGFFTKYEKSKIKQEDNSKEAKSVEMFQGISKELFLEYRNRLIQAKDSDNVSSDEILRAIVRDFLLNQMGFNIEFTKVFSGDPAFYGTEDSFFKRMSMINSTRKISAIGESLDNDLNKYNGAKLLMSDGSIKKISQSKAIRIIKGEEELDPDVMDMTLMSGFRMDRRRHDSSFDGIVFKDHKHISKYAVDNVNSIDYDKKTGKVTYFDKDKNEVDIKDVAPYRVSFVETFIREGVTDNRMLHFKTEVRLKPYRSIDETDGFSLMSIDEYKELLMRSGDWQDEHDAAYLKILKGIPLKSNEYYLFQPQKTQYSGPMDMKGMLNADPNYFVPNGYKHAIVPLLPVVVKGTQMEPLANWMQENQIGMASFASANKFGTIGGRNINEFYTETKDGKLVVDPSKWDASLKQRTFYEFFSIQVENKPKLKESITTPSQKRKILTANIYQYGKATNEELGTLADEYIELQNAIIENEIKTLRRRLKVKRDKVTGELVIGNKNLLIEMLTDQAKSRDADDNILTAIKLIDNGMFLDELGSAVSIDNVLMAFVRSRLIKEKRPGESYAQAPVTGFEKDRVKSDSRLKYYRKNVLTGNLVPAQVVIPVRKDMLEYVDKIGGLDVLNKRLKTLHNKLYEIREEGNTAVELTEQEETLLKITTTIGSRIPTQQLGSMGVFEVVEFLPIEAGNTARVAPEIVAQMGSDMDWDKLNLEYPVFTTMGDKLIYYNNDDIDYMSEYADYVRSLINDGDLDMKDIVKRIALINAKKDTGNWKEIIEANGIINYYTYRVRRKMITTPEEKQEALNAMTDTIHSLIGVPKDKLAEIAEVILMKKGMVTEDFAQMSGLLSSDELYGYDLNAILDYISNSFDKLSVDDFKSSTLQKALLDLDIDHIDIFIDKINKSKGKTGFASKKYSYNRAIELQRDLLLHEERAGNFLAPVDDSPLAGADYKSDISNLGVVWKIRFLSDNSESNMDRKRKMMSEVNKAKELAKTDSRLVYNEVRDNTILRYTKEYIEEYKNNEENRSFFNIIDPIYNIDKGLAFLVGKSNIGIVARHITHHNLTQIANTYMNTPIILHEGGFINDNSDISLNINYVNQNGEPVDITTAALKYSDNIVRDENTGEVLGIQNRDLKKGGKIVVKPGDKVYPSLGGVTAVDGSNILENISAFINAYVDVAADPYVFDMNGNDEVVDSFMYMLRLGAPLDAVTMLLNQPSVVEFVRSKKKLTSNFRKAYNTTVPDTSIAADVMSKYDSENYFKLLSSEQFYALTPEQRADEYVKLGFVSEANKVDDKTRENYNFYLEQYNTWSRNNIKMMFRRKQNALSKLSYRTTFLHEKMYNHVIRRGKTTLWDRTSDTGTYKVSRTNPNEALFTNLAQVKPDDLDADVQKQALDMFLEIKRQAGNLRLVMDATSQDTRGTDKTYQETSIRRDTDVDTMSKMYVKNGEAIINKTVVRGFNQALAFAEELFAPLYTINSFDDKVRSNYLDYKKEILGTVYRTKDREKLSAYIDTEFINFLIHSKLSPSDSTIEGSEIFNNLIMASVDSRYTNKGLKLSKLEKDGKLSLIEFIRRVQNKDLSIRTEDDTEETRKLVRFLQNNSFFRRLEPVGKQVVINKDPYSLIKGRIAANSDINLSLGFPNSDFVKSERNKMIQDFKSIKKVDEGLYYDIISLAIAQFGVSGGRYSFSSLIPPEDLATISRDKLIEFSKLNTNLQLGVLEEFFSNRLFDNYRAITFLPVAKTTRTIPIPEGMEDFYMDALEGNLPRGPYFNIPLTDNTSKYAVYYRTNDLGESIATVYTNPQRSGNGIVYTEQVTIKGAPNWIGYDFKLTDDFIEKLLKSQEDYETIKSIRKDTVVSQSLTNFPLAQSDSKRISDGLQSSVLIRDSIYQNILNKEYKSIIRVGDSYYTLSPDGPVVIPEDASVEEAMSIKRAALGYSNTDDVKSKLHTKFIQGSPDMINHLVVRLEPVSQSEGVFLLPFSDFKEETLSDKAATQIKDVLSAGEADIYFNKINTNVLNDPIDIDSELNNPDSEYIEYVKLTPDTLRDYYKVKSELQRIYGRNISIAYDFYLDKHVTDLREYFVNNYNVNDDDIINVINNGAEQADDDLYERTDPNTAVYTKERAEKEQGYTDDDYFLALEQTGASEYSEQDVDIPTAEDLEALNKTEAEGTDKPAEKDSLEDIQEQQQLVREEITLTNEQLEDEVTYADKYISLNKGKYRLLNNDVIMRNPIVDEDGLEYYTVEAYFQSRKTTDYEERKYFTGQTIINSYNKEVDFTGNIARQKGKNVSLREDWDLVKVQAMRDGIRMKFQNNPALKKDLLSTGNRQLVFSSQFNKDEYWGINSTKRKGSNVIGKLLEEYRGIVSKMPKLTKNYIVDPVKANSFKDLRDRIDIQDTAIDRIQYASIDRMKKLHNEGKGVYTLKVNRSDVRIKSKRLKGLNTKNHLGNPFSRNTAVNRIRVGFNDTVGVSGRNFNTTEQEDQNRNVAVTAFYDWLTGKDYPLTDYGSTLNLTLSNVEPARRKFIVDFILNADSNTKLLYFTSKYNIDHSKVLSYLIDNKELLPEYEQFMSDSDYTADDIREAQEDIECKTNNDGDE